MEDQRSDLQRVLDALEDLEPQAPLEVLRSLGSVLRSVGLGRHRGGVRSGADRRGAGRHDGAAVRDRVRPRHDDRGGDAARPGERAARRGALDAQPPAAVRRRRDHPHLGHDDGSRMRSARCARGRTRRWRRSSPRCAARAGSTPREVYEITVVRQRDDDAPGAGHRSRAAVDGAVRRLHALVPGRARARLRRSRSIPRAPAFAVPVARRVRRRRHRGRACSRRASRAIGGCGCSSTSAPTARSRSGRSIGVVATAAPAGPAFEAAQIRCGMRAAPGAIEGVKIRRRPVAST